MKWIRRWFGAGERPDPSCRDATDQFLDEHERILRDQQARLRMLEADADLISRRYPKNGER